MRVHEVLIVPCEGHAGPGKFSRGRTAGNMSELDVVDGYVRGLVDELDGCAIRYRVMPTRTAPGIAHELRHHSIMRHTLILSCHVGWFKASSPAKIPAANLSRVFFGAKDLFPLAKRVCEAMDHWGQLYGGFGHRGAAAADEEDQLLNLEGTWGMRLEPFALNGPNAMEYCKRLENLGRDVGRVLTNYLISKDHARNKPSTLDTYQPRGTF